MDMTGFSRPLLPNYFPEPLALGIDLGGGRNKTMTQPLKFEVGLWFREGGDGVGRAPRASANSSPPIHRSSPPTQIFAKGLHEDVVGAVSKVSPGSVFVVAPS